MSEPCSQPNASPGLREVWAHFETMIDRCIDHVDSCKAAGRHVVGIMCEFTPRELILAAGATPVCLCGGSGDTISAAEQHLPANLCPLIKSTYGYLVKGSNPFLHAADLVVAEMTCDGKKKMFELMGAVKPMHILALPHREADPQALLWWRRELQGLRECLEQQFRTTITDEKLRDAIRLMNWERELRRRLASLMTRTPPPLTGRQLLELKSVISGLPADLDHYERALQIFEKSPGAVPDNAPRVLMTGVPMVHGAERVLEIIESCGAVVVAQENCTGLKPIMEDVDEHAADPLEAIARKYYHLPCSVMTPNTGRMTSLQSLAAQYKPDCVIELVWQACLTYDVESFNVRRLVEEKLGIPYLKITTDYSPSDSSRIRTRVEATLECLRR
jgi:benzoyl-CoA reductase/2-hydroxyglutaryl-CoA dehydratase subunit BcrC/BadD/HgdB